MCQDHHAFALTCARPTHNNVHTHIFRMNEMDARDAMREKEDRGQHRPQHLNKYTFCTPLPLAFADLIPTCCTVLLAL